MGFREIKEASRQVLHDFMGQPAHYFANAQAPGVYVVTKARPHAKSARIGDLPGTNLNYAEVFDRKERVILWRSEIPAPARGGLVVFSATEGYWIDTAEPPDGQTITVNVTRATDAELLGLPLPGAGA